MNRRYLATVCLGLILAATLHGGLAAAAATLTHKLPEGTSFTTETNVRLKQTLKIAGMEFESAADTRTAIKSTVGKRGAEGNLPVEQTMEALQVTINAQGMNYNFDSANPDQAGGSLLESMRPLHKALANNKTTTFYDADIRAVDVKTDENALNAVPMELRTLVQSAIDPQHLKNQANQALDQVKTGTLKPGDSWQRLETIDFGAGQVMDFTQEYTYEGTVEHQGKKLDKIASKAISVGFAFDKSPLPFTLKSSELKPDGSTGVILFDRERGQSVESKSTAKIAGSMVFTINNMDVPAELDLVIESESIVKPTE